MKPLKDTDNDKDIYLQHHSPAINHANKKQFTNDSKGLTFVWLSSLSCSVLRHRWIRLYKFFTVPKHPATIR